MRNASSIIRENYLQDYYENNAIKESDKEKNIEPMRNLWIAVLEQIIKDIKIDCLIHKGRYARIETAEFMKWKRRAISFVRKTNEDFTVLCELSGYDSVIVWQAFQKVVREHAQKK